MARGELVRMVGGEQLARVAADLKAASPRLRRKLPARIRAAVEPARRAAESKARQVMPGHPVRVRAVVGMRSPTIANVRVVVDASQLPPKRRALPRLMELGSQGGSGRVIRHPVFGHDVWVSQPTHPYFYKTMYEYIPAVDIAMRRVLDEVGRDAGLKR